MSLFGICELKNLTAEYVEEKLALEAADAPTDSLDIIDLDEALAEIDESAYIDSLLKILN